MSVSSRDAAEEFEFFYPPDADALTSLWQDVEVAVAVDTNVLLNLHRVQAREKLFDALVTLGERLWIPFQVAVEYHLARDSQIAEQRSGLTKLSDFLVSTANKLDEFKNLKEQHVDFDPTPSLTKIQASVSDATTQIEKVLSKIPGVEAEPMVPRVRSQLLSRVGRPLTQVEIDEIQTEGDARYENKWPPGFKDKKQGEKKWQEWDGLRYQRRFGDLIIWKELLREFVGKKLIWISHDVKEDWVERRYGVTAPRRELLYEARAAGLTGFWIFQTGDLLANLSDVSTEELAEVRQADRTQVESSKSARVLRYEDEIDEMLCQLLECIEENRTEEALKIAEYLHVLFEPDPDIHPNLDAIIDWAKGELPHKRQVGRKIYSAQSVAHYAAEKLMDAFATEGEL